MLCMAILQSQSLQYLNFIHEQKVQSYALKQGIWRVPLFNISTYFSKVEKMEEKLPTLSP